MPSGLPIELRQRIVVAHIDQAMEPVEIAEVFQVSISSVRRYLALAAKGESLAPRSAPGGTPKLRRAELDWLRADLEVNPLTTSYELTSRYRACRHLRLQDIRGWFRYCGYAA